MSIVSLVPSLTQTVIDLGGGDRLVGRTRFCPHPDGPFPCPTIGGTKDVRVDKVLAMKPDLVLAVREESVREHVEALAAKVPVVVYDITRVEEVPALIEDLALRCALFSNPVLNDCLEALAKPKPQRGPRVAYLIWRDPWMTIGGDTYIHDVIERCGATNVMGDRTRYPVTSPGELQSLDVDEVWLSSEPYPFKENKAAHYATELGLPLRFVDGQRLSWYGSLMAEGLAYGKLLVTEWASGLARARNKH